MDKSRILPQDKKYIFFDLDGTLLNTLQDLASGVLTPERLALLPPERQAWQAQRVFPAGQALQRRVLPWQPAVVSQPLLFQSLAWQLALRPVLY